MSPSLMAAAWGWLAGSSLLIGSFLGYKIKFSQKTIASVMAFGSGVLTSAISFDLMDEAFQQGGLFFCGFGFVAGAIIYTLAVRAVNQRGARYRKRSGHFKPPHTTEASGMALAIGALIDGIPESIVIGLSLLAGKQVNLVAVFAIFISNIPEGLSSANGMKRSGRSAAYVFGLWTAITFISGIASYLGYTIFGKMSPHIIATTTSVAAGGMLSMIVDTMIPEAFENEQDWAGIITVLGFLTAFATSKMT
jgi:ZIP family zinc transporter